MSIVWSRYEERGVDTSWLGPQLGEYMTRTDCPVLRMRRQGGGLNDLRDRTLLGGSELTRMVSTVLVVSSVSLAVALHRR